MTQTIETDFNPPHLPITIHPVSLNEQYPKARHAPLAAAFYGVVGYTAGSFADDQGMLLHVAQWLGYAAAAINLAGYGLMHVADKIMLKKSLRISMTEDGLVITYIHADQGPLGGVTVDPKGFKAGYIEMAKPKACYVIMGKSPNSGIGIEIPVTKEEAEQLAVILNDAIEYFEAKTPAQRAEIRLGAELSFEKRFGKPEESPAPSKQ